MSIDTSNSDRRCVDVKLLLNLQNKNSRKIFEYLVTLDSLKIRQNYLGDPGHWVHIEVSYVLVCIKCILYGISIFAC